MNVRFLCRLFVTAFAAFAAGAVASSDVDPAVAWEHYAKQDFAAEPQVRFPHETCFRVAALEYATALAEAPRRSQGRWNRAAAVGARIGRRLQARLGVRSEMLADDFVWSEIADGAEPVMGAGDLVDAIAGLNMSSSRSGAHLQLRPFAVRDDLFMVAAESDGDSTEASWLTMVAVDEHDRLRRLVRFPPGTVSEAMTELDRSWWATLTPTHRTTVRVAGAFGRAFRDQDLDAFERVLATDFVAIEHHDFGLGAMERSEYLRSHAERTELFGPTSQFYDVVFLPSPEVMLVRSAAVTSPGDVGWEDVVWNVLHIRDGRLARIEVRAEFDPNDPAPREWAHQRADELARSLEGAGVEDGVW